MLALGRFAAMDADTINHIGKFVSAVIGQWATLATGGLIMGIIALWEKYHSKPIPRKLMLSIFVFFLFVAFFRAWEIEYIAATPEMQITVLVKNSGKEKIEINAKFSGEFVETIGGSYTSYNDQAFLLFPKNKKLEESSFIIPAGESREYEVRISDDKKSIYERGASDFTFSLYDWNGKADGRIPFNKDSIHTQPAVVNFTN